MKFINFLKKLGLVIIVVSIVSCASSIDINSSENLELYNFSTFERQLELTHSVLWSGLYNVKSTSIKLITFSVYKIIDSNVDYETVVKRNTVVSLNENEKIMFRIYNSMDEEFQFYIQLCEMGDITTTRRKIGYTYSNPSPPFSFGKARRIIPLDEIEYPIQYIRIGSSEFVKKYLDYSLSIEELSKVIKNGILITVVSKESVIK